MKKLLFILLFPLCLHAQTDTIGGYIFYGDINEHLSSPIFFDSNGIVITPVHQGTFLPIGTIKYQSGLYVADTLTTQTEYGIVCGSCADKIKAAQLVGVTWIRIDVSLDTYSGRNILKKYYDSGLNVIATVKWSFGVDTFTTDTSRYKELLDSFINHNLDTTKKLWLVIANEELNPTNVGSAADYVNLLTAATRVAEKYNLNISDGGLTFSILKLKIFIDMMDAHTWDKADSFRVTCIPRETRDHLQNPTYNNWEDIRFLDTVVSGIKQITYPLFFTNFHYYAPALYAKEPDNPIVDTISSDKISILRTTVDWLRENSQHQVICNEMGQLNLSDQLLRGMLRNVVKTGLPILIWKAGDNNDSKGLFNEDGTLRLNGISFKKFVIK